MILEKNRKSIGWFSILGGVTISIIIAFIAMKEHNNAVRERIHVAKMRANVSNLEDSVRDMVSLSDRGLAILYAGTPESGDEVLVGWSPALVTLLGWTLEDINEKGLGIIMTGEADHYKHQAALEKALKRPPGQRRTAVIHCNAKCKDGSMLQVRITAWVVGDLTRSVAAYIEAESNIFEQTINN